MSDCPRFGKLIGGCRFEPRYDLGVPQYNNFRGSPGRVLEAIEASRPKTYVRDVCVTCGRTIERANGAKAK